MQLIMDVAVTVFFGNAILLSLCAGTVSKLCKTYSGM